MDQASTDQEAYNELAFYTLAHAAKDRSFIHQYVVDAYAASHADEKSKPIYVAFALAGLYLHLEKGYTGRQVQLAHLELAKHKERLPRFDLPEDRPQWTIQRVLQASPGRQRDEAIDEWQRSVWQTWEKEHANVAQWIKSELGV
jgi:Family of unknown function (DUF5946)